MEMYRNMHDLPCDVMNRETKEVEEQKCARVGGELNFKREGTTHPMELMLTDWEGSIKSCDPPTMAMLDSPRRKLWHAW